jgi:hypothetical protein
MPLLRLACPLDRWFSIPWPLDSRRRNGHWGSAGRYAASSRWCPWVRRSTCAAIASVCWRCLGASMHYRLSALCGHHPIAATAGPCCSRPVRMPQRSPVRRKAAGRILFSFTPDAAVAHFTLCGLELGHTRCQRGELLLKLVDVWRDAVTTPLISAAFPLFGKGVDSTPFSGAATARGCSSHQARKSRVT